LTAASEQSQQANHDIMLRRIHRLPITQV